MTNLILVSLKVEYIWEYWNAKFWRRPSYQVTDRKWFSHKKSGHDPPSHVFGGGGQKGTLFPLRFIELKSFQIAHNSFVQPPPPPKLASPALALRTWLVAPHDFTENMALGPRAQMEARCFQFPGDIPVFDLKLKKKMF